jgi:hypothetical protein
MSEPTMIIDQMDYAGLTQNALRGVIRQALNRAADEGLPGEHHFYVTFLTRAKGVSIPPDLLARYPYDITIVLQHQYQDLRVAEDFFRVTLTFGGVPKILTVPFAAITRFHDPYAQFMLEFEAEDAPIVMDEAEDETDEAAGDDASGEDEPKIVSLDQFRKK